MVRGVAVVVAPRVCWMLGSLCVPTFGVVVVVAVGRIVVFLILKRQLLSVV